MHAGILKSHSGSGYGYRAYLLLGGIGDPCFHYAHLGAAATNKEWVMSGEIIGTSGRSYHKTATEDFPNNEPSHLHLEFIASATTTTPAIGGTKVPFSEIVDINPSEDKPYSAPTGGNAFLFQGNSLPLLLPCQCHYGSDQNVSLCRVGNGTHQEHKTCYAITKFPYENNLLLSNIPNMVSHNLHPDSGIIRYICPHILGVTANMKVQLQAKIKFLHVNKNRFSPTIFPHDTDETETLNSLLTTNIANLSIDGDIGNGTKSAIRTLIQAHYYCVNNDNEDNERILANDDDKISNEKIQAFVDKYTDDDEIPSEEAYNVVIEFYEWFTNDPNVNFINMCLNAPL